jgi:hypothetical protein
MFAAIPPILGLLARYYVTTEAIKFATGTSRQDWIKMSLDISEQIGDIYEARLREGKVFPIAGDPVGTFYGELVTLGAGALGAPGTAAEALGYTFPGAAAKQRQRLEAEVSGGFPFTRARIKGAPTFAKRKLSTWNKEIKKAYKVAKANKNQFGKRGVIKVPKKAFPKIVKIVAALRKGKKQKSTAGKQIAKALKIKVSKFVSKIKKTQKRRYG